MTVLQQTIYIMAVFYIGVCVMLLMPFYILKCRFGHSMLIYWAATMVEFLVTGLIRYYLPGPMWLRFVSNMVIYGAIVYVLFEDGIRRKMALLISEMVLLLLEELITYILMCELRFLGDFDLEMYEIGTHQGTVIANMVGYMLNMYFIVGWRYFVEHKRGRSLLVHLLVPLYHMVLLAAFLNQAEQFSWKMAVFGLALLILGILVGILIVYLFDNLEQKTEMEEELTVLYQQRQNELNYYRMTEQYIAQMREIRHDFVNQIQTAQVMIQKGDGIEQAEELLSKSYARLQDVKLMRYCENPVANALISAKQEKATSNGIAFHVLCRSEKFERMEEIDICSLLGNLLDNAIEACSKIPDGKERRVDLMTWSKGDYVMIQVINTYEPQADKKDFFETDKLDGLNHGYGMKLIERICRKYGGELRKQIVEGRVSVTAYLKL